MFTKRQQQIVETAIGLIAHKGIQNLTIKNLALQIGISEPALHRHFKNKLEIMKSILKYFQLTMQPSMLELKKEGKAIDKINDFTSKNYSDIKVAYNNKPIINKNMIRFNFSFITINFKKRFPSKIIKTNL